MKRRRECVSSTHIFYHWNGLTDFYEIWHRGDSVNVAEWIYLCLWHENIEIILRRKKPVCCCCCRCCRRRRRRRRPLSGIKQTLCIARFQFRPFLGWVASTFTFEWATLHGVRRQLLLNKYRIQRKVVHDSVVWYLWCYGHCDGSCVSAVSDPPDLWVMYEK